jgi:hypothetical protein
MAIRGHGDEGFEGFIKAIIITFLDFKGAVKRRNKFS